MKKLKKYLILLLALVLALSLSACKADTNDKSEDKANDSSKDTPVKSPELEDKEEEKKEKGNAIHKELLENPPFMEVVNDFNFKKEGGNWVLVNADEINENILNAMIVE